MVERYLVWSNEHRAWWRPDRCGYTRNVTNAGIYSRADAIEIARASSTHIDWTCTSPDEIAVRIDDLSEDVRKLTAGD